MLFDELKELEDKTGFILSNSPTQTVGYEPISKFEKVVHTVPMLSLDKTQDINKFIEFCSKNNVLLMHKLDGLTCRLIYEDGKLVQANTRGDGTKGDIITTNAKCFENVPLTIPIKDNITLTGEAIMTRDIFEEIKKNNPDKDYKNPRNLASGTVKQLDPNIVKERHISWVCWNANDLSTDGTMSSGLDRANELGFTTVRRFIPIDNLNKTVPECIDKLKDIANSSFIPIDGIVAVYDNIEYGNSLGKTAHHFNNGFAFKFYDEEETTVLRDVFWGMGKTGELTPVAIFDPVELDGTTVTRASLHNVSILKGLELGIGDEVTVYKANSVIPQIRKNLTKSNTYKIPNICPICGGKTAIHITANDKIVEVRKCENPNCSGKLLGKLTHYVSKSAMNIDGLSESTISKFIDLGYLNSILDIYSLQDKKFEISMLDGFGEVSVNKMIKAIENSKTTTLDRLLNSVSIPTIGTSNAKVLADYVYKDNGTENDIFKLGRDNLTVIDGIGSEMNTAIHKWFNNDDNINLINNLLNILTFTKPTKPTSAKFAHMNFVVTGKVYKYKNRSDLESTILHNGGTLQSAVSSTTNYLINNDINSGSSKNKKAKELNIPVITEDDFLNMLGTDESATKDIQPTSNVTNTNNTNVSATTKGKTKLF
jgi:DNA ligase (NAD+)